MEILGFVRFTSIFPQPGEGRGGSLLGQSLLHRKSWGSAKLWKAGKASKFKKP